MLVEFSLQNLKSFNDLQTFSMVGSTSTKEGLTESNTVDINKFNIKKIVKSSAIFGSNASGKSNFITCLLHFRQLILDSFLTGKSNLIENALPFLLKENRYDIPSEYEISFIKNEVLYRYGIAFNNNEILEEWLYCNKNIRETKLFHREKQNIDFNKSSFAEAKDFTKNEDNKTTLIKTKKTVPFISLLSQFDGEISTQITEWFEDLRVVSGININRIRDYTLTKIIKDNTFKDWTLTVLKNFQIDDIVFLHSEISEETLLDNDIEPSNIKNESNDVILLLKLDSDGISRPIPLALESEGTKKLIYMLGPIYDVIKNNRILIIDEFDSQFHTLLSKHLISIFQQHNEKTSQLIISTHDTNLLDKDIFRRDQIWFVEKNQKHESKLFSLIEYKDHYTRSKDSYKKDYLEGKYGAIPLFNNIKELEEVISNGK